MSMNYTMNVDVNPQIHTVEPHKHKAWGWLEYSATTLDAGTLASCDLAPVARIIPLRYSIFVNAYSHRLNIAPIYVMVSTNTDARAIYICNTTG
jgi:hypothetical protein